MISLGRGRAAAAPVDGIYRQDERSCTTRSQELEQLAELTTGIAHMKVYLIVQRRCALDFRPSLGPNLLIRLLHLGGSAHNQSADALNDRSQIASQINWSSKIDRVLRHLVPGRGGRNREYLRVAACLTYGRQFTRTAI